MPLLTQPTTLREVEHILASGSGVLDFAVVGEQAYYTWNGTEDADWEVEDVEKVENAEEDRLLIYPEGDSFVCEITAEAEERNVGPVRCYCE
jgi:hypothetical protein